MVERQGIKNNLKNWTGEKGSTRANLRLTLIDLFSKELVLLAASLRFHCSIVCYGLTVPFKTTFIPGHSNIPSGPHPADRELLMDLQDYVIEPSTLDIMIMLYLLPVLRFGSKVLNKSK